MLEHAKEKGLYDAVAKLDMSMLPWPGIPSEAFDVVACNGVLIYVDEVMPLPSRGLIQGSWQDSLPPFALPHTSYNNSLGLSGYTTWNLLQGGQAEAVMCAAALLIVLSLVGQQHQCLMPWCGSAVEVSVSTAFHPPPPSPIPHVLPPLEMLL